MATVRAERVVKRFGAATALDGVSLTFEEGAFCALLGPSGCGKTTLLRLIAGFDAPDSGHIEMGGARVEAIPVERRDVGMVFQSYALFPNMSVAENVAFGLRARGVSGAELRRRVDEALALVRLDGLGERRPHALSGGQRQRVALARAVAIRPRVLLLDEPLSALDKALRVEMQVELKRIQREVGVTTVFVTHDQEEALSLSDHVGVLREGALVQAGAPRALYERPATAFAATFLGDANLFEGEASGAGLDLGDGVRLSAAAPVAPGDMLAVRPEKMRVLAAEASAEGWENALDATVESQVFAGPSLTYQLRWRGRALKVFAQNVDPPSVAPGEPTRVVWRAAHSMPVAP